MLIEVMCSKIHRATVTDANLEYVGSITIDKNIMEAAKILSNQKVQIVNNNNGARLETYVIEGQAGKGDICLNGAAARLALKGDIIIIIAYGQMEYEEAKNHQPEVVFVDENNKVKEIFHHEEN